jgi:ParB family transcriptional regulator, chromosome partitioning protein
MLPNNSVISKDLTAKIKIEDIKIDKRFRKDVGDIKKLANSISEVGLLHPLVLNENNELVAGQRRLEACKLLGWSEVPVNIVNLKDIVKGEFHENANRKDFTISEIVEIKKP